MIVVSEADGDGDEGDPDHVLLSLEDLVPATVDTLARLRQLQRVTRGLGDEEADRSVSHLIALMLKIHGHLTGLCDRRRLS